MKSIGVIRERPEDYVRNADLHREVWTDSDPQWKLDGRLIVNFDEVPYTIDYDTNQLVADGERISLHKNTMNRLKKYREGTIGLFISPEEVLMVIIIYRKCGGPDVRAELNDLEMTADAKVMMCGTEKGTMNAEIWPQCLEAFANMTRDRRGVTELDGVPIGDSDDERVGDDWLYGIALYVDSYRVHLNRSVAMRMAELYGIFVRALLTNASHLMQAVDRNVGVTYKNKYRSKVLTKDRGMRNLLLLDVDDYKMETTKWRQICAGIHCQIFVEVHSL